MLRAAWLTPVLALAAPLLVACGAPNSTTARFDAPTLAPPRPGDPRTNPAVAQACREQAAREIQRQDRGQLLREDESNSRQGSGFGALPATSQSDLLGRQFLFDRRINECIRANTQTDPSVQPAPAATTPAAAPAPSTRRPRTTRTGT
ncbi:hypothetical protein [Sediminicoccus sp. KRV36]|uniref:hypothetical protein n=1 Tax=Sediminicoccus sp. KRV36 TaxID=3133721 RepID=UPI00200EA2B7|nr:hypothetical protein [Sediminicoccus rosea]UPY38548.1 hypothetical protein LHU95_07595 [Sediminicoccus rosea]